MQHAGVAVPKMRPTPIDQLTFNGNAPQPRARDTIFKQNDLIKVVKVGHSPYSPDFRKAYRRKRVCDAPLAATDATIARKREPASWCKASADWTLFGPRACCGSCCPTQDARLRADLEARTGEVTSGPTGDVVIRAGDLAISTGPAGYTLSHRGAERTRSLPP